MIDWSSFTPWPSVAGGALIGAAVAMLWLVNGRIAGISGICAGLLTKISQIQWWRLAFLIGLLLAPVAWQLFAPLPEIRLQTPGWLLAVAGLVVGVGVQLGSGCTSGHGVCGMARLSKRSVVATLIFMGTAMLTVLVLGNAGVAP
ncbi:YeeE/YedE thiosulfate transporter family protein [Rheinheimera sp.]|uniref:YeeE/YedE family protein n=1 Tax=Rheinheimera sp. TaxID=1869214 RepID=UPI00307F0F34